MIDWSECWGREECSFESFLRPDLLGSKDERCLFSCEGHEWVSEPSEVLNKHSDYADGAEEGSYFGEVFAWAPVDDLSTLEGSGTSVATVRFGTGSNRNQTTKVTELD